MVYDCRVFNFQKLNRPAELIKKFEPLEATRLKECMKAEADVRYLGRDPTTKTFLSASEISSPHNSEVVKTWFSAQDENSGEDKKLSLHEAISSEPPVTNLENKEPMRNVKTNEPVTKTETSKEDGVGEVTDPVEVPQAERRVCCNRC